MGGAGAYSTGAGGESSKSESTVKGLTEAKREGVIGGGSRRRLCCVCGLVIAGREKIDGGTDIVTRGEDQVIEGTSRTRMLMPSDFGI